MPSRSLVPGQGQVWYFSEVRPARIAETVKRGAAAFSLVAAWLCQPTTAAAAEQLELDYPPVAGCPSQDWVRAELADYLSQDGRASLLSVSVHMTPNDSGYHGAAAVAFETGEASKPKTRREPRLDSVWHWSRELNGAQCAEIVSALFMSLSLYFDSLGGEAEQKNDAGPPSTPATELTDELPGKVEGEVQAVSLSPAFTDSVRPPPKKVEKRMTWGLLPIAGLRLRTGLTESPNWAANAGLDVRGLGDRFEGARFGVGFEVSEGSTKVADELRQTSDPWNYSYWAASGHACPLAFSLSSWARLLPCASAYFGGYQGGTLVQVGSSGWVGFWEATAQLFFRKAPLVTDVSLGIHGPMSPLVVQPGSPSLPDQGLGLVVGVGLGLMPDAWIFL